jgi:polysaccharide transporter, PST family
MTRIFTLRPFTESGEFRVAPEGKELRSRTARGAGVSVAGQVFGVITQMGVTMVLARLLAPSDFGLVTIVTTVSLLLTSFGLNGFSEAILQLDDLDHSLVSNLFWINLAAGTFLTAAFAASGWLLMKFFGDARIPAVAAGMSLTIICTSVSVVHLALLKRAMYFTVVSTIDVLARFASALVSILCARAGWGYWALVIGAIASSLGTSLGAWYACQWIPSPPRRVPRTGVAVRYAIHVFGRFSLNYCARNTDNFLVGWKFSSQWLGFYKKAYDLFVLAANQLITPLTTVAVAALSRLKHDRNQYRAALLQALAMMAFVGMGAGALLSLAGHDIILVLLGDQWGPAAQIFRFFGPGIGALLIYNLHGWIHLSIGTPERWLRWGLVEFIVTVLLLVAGLAWGPVGVAAGWTVSYWVLIVPAFSYAGHPIQLGAGAVLAAVWRFILAALLASAAVMAATDVIPFFADAEQTWAAAAIHAVKISGLFSCLYVGAVVLLHGGTAPVQQMIGTMALMLPSFGRKRPALSQDAAA